jgi:hypothetical protein
VAFSGSAFDVLRGLPDVYSFGAALGSPLLCGHRRHEHDRAFPLVELVALQVLACRFHQLPGASADLSERPEEHETHTLQHSRLEAGCFMKFRFLVSGPALSEAQIEALRHSIEDLAQSYGMDKFSTPFLVEQIPSGQTLRVIVDESVPLPTALRCGHCGALLTAEQAWSHLCPKGSKSARRWLKWDDVIPKAAPLQLVVWSVELAFSLFGLWNLLKLLAS